MRGRHVKVGAWYETASGYAKCEGKETLASRSPCSRSWEPPQQLTVCNMILTDGHRFNCSPRQVVREMGGTVTTTLDQNLQHALAGGD